MSDAITDAMWSHMYLIRKDTLARTEGSKGVVFTVAKQRTKLVCSLRNANLNTPLVTSPINTDQKDESRQDTQCLYRHFHRWCH